MTQREDVNDSKYKLQICVNYILYFFIYLSKGIIFGFFICVFLIAWLHKYEKSHEYWYKTTVLDNNENINASKYIYSANVAATNLTHLSWWINDTSTCNLTQKCLYSDNHRFLHGHGGHGGHSSSHFSTGHSNSGGYNSRITSNKIARQAHILYFYRLVNNHTTNNNYIIKKEINTIPIDFNNICSEMTVSLSCNENNITAFIGSIVIEPADTFMMTFNKLYKTLIISLIICMFFSIIKFVFSIHNNKNKYNHSELL